MTSPPSRPVSAPPWRSGAGRGAERPSRPLGPRSSWNVSLWTKTKDNQGNGDVYPGKSWDLMGWMRLKGDSTKGFPYIYIYISIYVYIIIYSCLNNGGGTMMKDTRPEAPVVFFRVWLLISPWPMQVQRHKMVISYHNWLVVSTTITGMIYG